MFRVQLLDDVDDKNLGNLEIAQVENIKTGQTELHIWHADPRTMIIEELATKIVADELRPYVWLEFAPNGAKLFVFDCTNRKVIYRVCAYLIKRKGYLIEWPD